MKLVKATEADSERLKAFFERMTLPGSIDFSIRRRGSFFDHYRLISDDFETRLLLNEAGDIEGMASLVFREGYVNGEKQIWGYATDLRIAPTRRAIVQWAEHFLPVLEEATEERRCRYVFSALELHDQKAYNALIRPTSHGRRKLPRYHLLNRFRVINIHGRIPFSAKPLTSIRLTALDLNAVEELCAYLLDRSRNRALTSKPTPENFLADMKRWPDLRLEDFRIARDSKGKIIGCAAMWDGRRVQQIVPVAYNGFANTLHQTLGLASYLRLVRPTPAPGKELPIRFLTHLTCDSAEVFHRLLDDGYSRLRPRELLAYLHFRGNWRTLPPESFVATSLPFGMYMILPPTVEAPPWPSYTMETLPPEFEIAWL